MNRGIFAAVQMILFSFLGFFVPSSSGLATLSMPINGTLGRYSWYIKSCCSYCL
ncbi:hypothetical protein [Proteiniborus sp.]|uniref:hypothetical protein n=1 Tax=Proteiniborus sp. TaxID=2079015 RepID=UPI0033284457